MHCPKVHVCPGRHARHIEPRLPQAFADGAATHAPDASQHPAQVDAEQLSAAGPHDDAVANATPMINPTTPADT